MSLVVTARGAIDTYSDPSSAETEYTLSRVSCSARVAMLFYSVFWRRGRRLRLPWASPQCRRQTCKHFVIRMPEARPQRIGVPVCARCVWPVRCILRCVVQCLLPLLHANHPFELIFWQSVHVPSGASFISKGDRNARLIKIRARVTHSSYLIYNRTVM